MYMYVSMHMLCQILLIIPSNISMKMQPNEPLKKWPSRKIDMYKIKWKHKNYKAFS